ncbi:Abi family protein [Thermus sp. PS18]|uniref:Abi family protein n=1 Tax=Thermus sp. PS18 TaxID=2849039 RepID=UPI0022642C55|nr:Abi family protein [Thermus sp. PS18]UZX16382.1 Abi family protein [Thermus sp. PS18]
MARPYAKRPLSLEEQLSLLEERGLIIGDRKKALDFVSKVQYTRLRAYWHVLEENIVTHKFRSGANFDEVLLIYMRDRRLRLLVFEAIEHIEVVLRSQWAYHLAHAKGPHAYLDGTIVQDKSTHLQVIGQSLKEWGRHWKHDPQLSHFQAKYTDAFPPIWLLCETISFGTLARFLDNIRDAELGKKVASAVGLPFSYLKKAVRHLVVVRNIVAHHGRLWDRKITAFTLGSPEKHPITLRVALQQATDPQRVYRTLALLVYIGGVVGYHREWYPRLRELLEEYGDYLYSRMGFPEGWETLEVWSSTK